MFAWEEIEQVDLDRLRDQNCFDGWGIPTFEGPVSCLAVKLAFLDAIRFSNFSILSSMLSNRSPFRYLYASLR